MQISGGINSGSCLIVSDFVIDHSSNNLALVRHEIGVVSVREMKC